MISYTTKPQKNIKICVNYIIMNAGIPENKGVINKKKVKMNALHSAVSVADNP